MGDAAFLHFILLATIGRVPRLLGSSVGSAYGDLATKQILERLRTILKPK
jgi:hypothetical protein